MDKQSKPSANGRYWIHVPSMNLRQTSGVEFRGKYVTSSEYVCYMEKKKLLENGK